MTAAPRSLEFLFDFGSPTTYVAYKRLPGMIERTGARLTWVPILLGGVFKATGNASPVAIPTKGAYVARDLARFARKYGVPLRFNPHFPIDTLPLMRGAVAYHGEDRFPDYLELCFDAMWREPRNLGDPAELDEVLASGGFDPAGFRERIARPDVKARLRENTERAVARGAFGAPTFFVGDEMFFGQDRLDWVEEALSGA